MELFTHPLPWFIWSIAFAALVNVGLFMIGVAAGSALVLILGKDLPSWGGIGASLALCLFMIALPGCPVIEIVHSPYTHSPMPFVGLLLPIGWLAGLAYARRMRARYSPSSSS